MMVYDVFGDVKCKYCEFKAVVEVLYYHFSVDLYPKCFSHMSQQERIIYEGVRFSE